MGVPPWICPWNFTLCWTYNIKLKLYLSIKKTAMKGLNKNWKTHYHIYLSCVKRPIHYSNCSRLQVSRHDCCKKSITSMCGAYPDYSRYEALSVPKFRGGIRAVFLSFGSRSRHIWNVIIQAVYHLEPGL